jgi:hypothetical protein
MEAGMTDPRADIMRAPGTADAPARRLAWLRRFGWPRRVLAIVAVVSFAVAAFAWVQVFSSAVGALTESPLATPGSTDRTFTPGRYGVFERTGTSRGGGGVTFTENDLPELRTGDVTVTGPTGATVPTRYMGAHETINQNGAVYTGVVEFHITEPGRYHVQIDRVPGQVIVTRDLLDGQASNLVRGLASGFVFVISAGALTISSIVVTTRRRRAERARWASGPPAPPFGWTPPAQTWAPPPPPGSTAAPPPPPPPWRPDGS